MSILALKRRIHGLDGLPALPEAVRTCLLSPLPFREVKAVLSADSALLQAVRNAAPDSRDLDGALASLGEAGVRRVLLGGTLPRMFPAAQSCTIDRAAFWDLAYAGAVLAERITLRLNSTHFSDAFIAGLLRDIGQLVLDAVMPEGYPKALEVVRAQGLFALEAERRELGVDHTLAGKWMGETWGLPDACVAVIWLHHHPPGSLDHTRYPVELIDIVALADLLARGGPGAGLEEGRLAPGLAERARRLQLTPSDLASLRSEQRASEARPTAGEASAITGETPGDVTRLRQTLQRQRSLNAFHCAVGECQERDAVLRVLAGALREAFDAPGGLCFVTGPEGGPEGVRWRSLGGALERVSAADAEWLQGIFQGSTSIEGALRGSGLLALPLSCGGSRMGQVVLDPGAGSWAGAPETLSELLAFLDAAGAALGRVERAASERAQAEELATALWKQELTYRKGLRAGRLAGIAGLAAGAAHEINNPLTAISGRAQMLLNHVRAPEDVRALETIIQQSRRVSKILMDLMQFARPAQPKLEAVGASQFVHKVVAARRDHLEARRVAVTEEYAPNTPKVRVDRPQMEQVLLNLLLNAEQALPASGGVLTVRVKPGHDRKSVVIQVADTGAGIAPEMLDRIFEPFFTTRKDGESTGLGLAVCHGVVEAHRGGITVHSTLGEGTTFTITLPADEAVEPAPAAPPSPAAAAARKPRAHSAVSSPRRPAILVVDPDADFREVVQASLQSRGFQTRGASDALEAMAAVLGYPVDLVLLNPGVIGLDGAPLIAQLLERRRSLPVIAISGGNAEEALRLGARASLGKPFEIERLLAEIRTILGTRNVA